MYKVNLAASALIQDDYMQFELAAEPKPLDEKVKQIILKKQKYLQFRASILEKLNAKK